MTQPYNRSFPGYGSGTDAGRHDDIPTADWIARQIAEAFPWNEAPRYLIRDRD
jgi:hypothetical protein